MSPVNWTPTFAIVHCAAAAAAERQLSSHCGSISAGGAMNPAAQVVSARSALHDPLQLPEHDS
jgi:hypothetical protein